MNISALSFTYSPDFLVERILYRDALMLVIDKPAGIPVHKGTGGGENLEQYFEALRFGLPRPPALAHRLDRPTSGCLILGRNRHALQTLGSLFTHNKIRKTYWAIVHGHPPESEGRIDAPLTKQSESNKRWWMKVAEDGQPATTLYKIMGQANGMTWLELTPLTGRTHQLRVHCAHMGCPIVGDWIYGDKESDTSHLQLHARNLTIPLYPKKADIQVAAPIPEHMHNALTTSGISKPL
jgi:tRNA pseudouridine32 synthase / 23S rRNA pseudouridine746 synthase